MTVPAHDRPHEGPAGPPVLPSLSALRVVELGAWVTAPAAAGILSDWGADVIKVEPPAGDPSRALYQSLGASVTENPTFAFDNRGKRSVVLDLSGEADRSRFDGLLDSADVFVTNVRAGALERLGLGPDETLGSCTRRSAGSARWARTETARAMTSARSGRAPACLISWLCPASRR